MKKRSKVSDAISTNKRWRLDPSPAKHNEYYKLELPVAWEPPCSHYSLSLDE